MKHLGSIKISIYAFKYWSVYGCLAFTLWAWIIKENSHNTNSCKEKWFGLESWDATSVIAEESLGRGWLWWTWVHLFIVVTERLYQVLPKDKTLQFSHGFLQKMLHPCIYLPSMCYALEGQPCYIFSGRWLHEVFLLSNTPLPTASSKDTVLGY